MAEELAPSQAQVHYKLFAGRSVLRGMRWRGWSAAASVEFAGPVFRELNQSMVVALPRVWLLNEKGRYVRIPLSFYEGPMVPASSAYCAFVLFVQEVELRSNRIAIPTESKAFFQFEHGARLESRRVHRGSFGKGRMPPEKYSFHGRCVLHMLNSKVD